LKSASIIGILCQMELHRMWTEQCDATTGIRNANYLIGEKFLDFIEAAEKDADFRSELPAFAARIRTLFGPQELAAYLAPTGHPAVTENSDIVHCASDSELVAQAWSHVDTLSES
jgi:hypothetical protein